MITYEEAFRRLKIEPTKDRKVIKRAYAAMAKKYHPEEQPEKWLRIKEAYEIALRGCDRENEGAESTGKVNPAQGQQQKETEEPWQSEKEEEQERSGELNEEEEREFNRLFTHIGEEAESNRKTQQKIQSEQIEEVLQRIRELGNERITDIQVWDHFFSTQEMEILCNDEVFERLGTAFGLLPMNKELYCFFKRWLKRIKEFGQGVPGFDGSVYGKDPFGDVQRRLNAAREEYWIKRIGKIVWIAGIAVVALVLYGLWTAGIIEPNPPKEETAPIAEEKYNENLQTQEETAPTEQEKAKEESLRASQLHEILVRYSRWENTEENKRKLEQIVETGVCLQEGIYLGGDYIPEERFILEDGLEPQRGKESEENPFDKTAGEHMTGLLEVKKYSFQLWAEEEGGLYILYIDPLQYGLKKGCRISCGQKGDLAEASLWTEKYGIAEEPGKYYYYLSRYKAVVVDIPARDEPKPLYVSLYQY